MNLSENILKLRKEQGLSQEQFAEKLEVSRQSVYKWESGQSSPDINYLMMMCDLFSCTLDSLVKGEVNADLNTIRKRFDNEYKRFSFAMATGVFLTICGLVVMMLMVRNNQEMIGTVGMFGFWIVSVGIFVYFGIQHGEFLKEYNIQRDEVLYSKETRQKFMKQFTLLITVAILIIVLALVLLIGLIGIYNLNELDASAIMFFTIAIGVFILVYEGIQHGKYHFQSVAEKKLKDNKLSSKISSVIMLLATITFLLLGFIWNLWHISWLVFPIGGIICGIIEVIFRESN